MKKKMVFHALFMILLVSCSKFDDIPITNEETISSQIVNDDYPLYYYLPDNYTEEKQYPVVYLLDGDWHTERMAYEINELRKNNEIPECILVGIGNSDERGRDYLYPEDESGDWGHADKFYKFLRDELIPHVESIYSVDTTSRILMGHSAGGFFVLYALFQTENPNPLFHGYIAASPSSFWKEGYLFGLEENLSNSLTDLQCSLYIGMGSDEGLTMVVLAEEMHERLLSRGYPGLKQKYQNFHKAAHESAAIPTFTNGLVFTLNN